MQYAGLLLCGIVIGCIGTLVGAGGGFLLVPLLVFLYPHEKPAVIASISLAVVFCNTLSGTVAYLRRRKVDVRSGLRFGATAIPGSVLGAFAVSKLPRAGFEGILGVVLIGAGAFMLISKGRPAEQSDGETGWMGPHIAKRPIVGMAISFVVGFLSSLLGIGGGVMHVAVLAQMLGFPVHVATATSHFVLAMTAGAGTITHIALGAFHEGWRRMASLGVGALIGAQIGAWWAKRASPALILRLLAVLLVVLGVRILIQSLAG
ncbi:MAG: sulfite exporter TauE/SafE family protein [Phycisphaeraceae bacterium]|nr:MAG: sulfite exporter TauE/SafE family protein [Phycisphaeraceae bacterium]